MIQVKVLYFAALRDIFKTGQATVTLPAGGTVQSLQAVLFKDQPKAQSLAKSLTCAVNREVVKPATRLKDRDEVAFLPPVSGG
jgi:molybdopterin converting factor subunit 1